MNTTPHTDTTPTREQAAALLAQAEGPRRAGAQISSAMIVFAIICTTAGFSSLILGFAEGQQLMGGIIAMVAYVLVAATLPLLIRLPAEARGFTKRWGVLMAVWGVLWVAAAIIITAVGNGTNENLQIIVPLLFSVAFLVLMILAITSEAARVQRERRALTPTATEA